MKNGCTQPTANNYNQFANTDNGTCTGCKDATGINYDNTVAVSDNTCVYIPSRHTTENTITVTVAHQSGVVFGTEALQRHLQFYFDRNQTNTFESTSPAEDIDVPNCSPEIPLIFTATFSTSMAPKTGP